MVKNEAGEGKEDVQSRAQIILPHYMTTSLAREMYQYCLGEPHSQALMWGEEGVVHSVNSHMHQVP